MEGQGRPSEEQRIDASILAAWQAGAEAMREASAKLLEQPGFVFAFETESIRKDVVSRVRSLPTPEVKR